MLTRVVVVPATVLCCTIGLMLRMTEAETGRVGSVTLEGPRWMTVAVFKTDAGGPMMALIFLAGALTPSMDSSPEEREACRNGRLRFRKGTRHGCGDELSSRCSLVVKVSGSTLPSIRPWMRLWTFVRTLAGCSPANFSRVAKKFLHLCLAVSGVI